MESQEFKNKIFNTSWITYSCMEFFSLEITMSLYEDLGLFFKVKNSLHLFIKNKLNEDKEIYALLLNNSVWEEAMFKRIIEEYSKTNPEDYNILKSWILSRFTLHFTDQPHWMAWLDICEYITDKKHKETKWVDFRFRNKEFVENFLLSQNTSEFENKIDSLNEELLSDWDLNLFANFEYVSLYSAVFMLQTYRIFKFQEFISKTIPTLLIKDINTLNTHAENYIKVNNMELQFKPNDVLIKINFLKN